MVKKRRLEGNAFEKSQRRNTERSILVESALQMIWNQDEQAFSWEWKR
jgi:hypothetical protein